MSKHSIVCCYKDTSFDGVNKKGCWKSYPMFAKIIQSGP